MKFLDLIYSISPESYVFIIFEDTKHNCSQKPCKVKNLAFQDIQNLKDLDVYTVTSYLPFQGKNISALLIKIGDKAGTERKLDVRTIVRQELKK